MAVLLGIVIARTIGPSGKGFLSYAMTAVGFVSVFFYGFSDSVLYQIGKQKYDPRSVNAAAITILAVVLTIVVPIFIAVAVFIPSQRPLAAAAAALPFAMYIQVVTPFIMLRNNVGLLNVISLAQGFGTALCTIPLLLFAHLGLPAALAVWLFFYVAAALRAAWAMRPIAQTSAHVPSAPNVLNEQAKFGLRAAGSSTAGYLNMRIDIFVVSIMLSPAALGWYTLAIGSGELMWQVSRAFVWSAMARIGSDPFAESAALVARLTRNTLAIVGSLGIVAFIAGPWLIVHVYGEGFAQAGAALRWALPGLVAYAAEVALTKFVVLQLGRPLAIVWVQLSAAALCAALTIATVGKFGINAAAGATSFTYLMVTVLLVSIFVRETKIPLHRLLLVQVEDFAHYTALVESMLRTLRLRSA